MRLILIVFAVLAVTTASAQEQGKWQGKFEQLDQMLPTPNEYRNSAGGPGSKYWQQRADYVIDAEIDEQTNILHGKETITYTNNSPESLSFLWLQLDQNVNKKGNEDFGYLFGGVRDSINTRTMQFLTRPIEFQAGHVIESVTDMAGKTLPTLINNTMMRIDLAAPLKPGSSVSFKVNWNYAITDRSMFLLSREGYEYFPEDDNRAYMIAHWYPRMCAFDDTEGWQNKQFRRLGEFTLEFGNYTVNITVPVDHLVASTGVLQNPGEVLSDVQQARLAEARKSYDKPVFIVTEAEAREKEKTKSVQKKTWNYKAENVRDFSFASSRKFIWDAQAVKLPTHELLAMSFYPKEGLPVWAEESTKAVKNAVEVYSKYTFDYPYPVAISVNTSNIGMEYPMISFNGGRPRNGVMSDNAKNGMITTIVHEVGHNFFPMIVNSDERQWMWMDEGMNTFLHTRTMAERYPQFHHTVVKDIVPYMKGDKSIMRPVMTTSDNETLNAMGDNFYQKPTVALTLLRETIMGPELFDQAFKEYANRWAFKRPRPADFFRTMEDATGVDLDWFWRGWFFGTDNVDVTLDEVKWFKVKQQQADPEKKTVKVQQGDLARKGKGAKAEDFSGGPQEFQLINTPGYFYGEFQNQIDDNQIRGKLEGKNLYEITLKNAGGLVSPVIIEWTFKDGSKEIERIPAEIWRTNEQQVKKVFVKDKEVVNVVVDPNFETADVNVEDNVFPKRAPVTKFDEIKKKQPARK